MPLSKKEFADLVRDNPGLSDDELLSLARGAEGPDPTIYQTVMSLLPRVGGAIGGAALGTAVAPGIGTILGGAAGAGLGELGGEAYEKSEGLRESYNPAQIAAQTALGAIPVVGKTPATIGQALLGRGAQGALMGSGATALTELAEGETPDISSLALGGALGGAMGAAGGAIERAVGHPAFQDAARRLHASERGALELGPFASDGVTVFEHRTTRPNLAELDPRFHGTGFPGAERARKQTFPEDYVPRTYATVEGGLVEGHFADMPVYKGAVPEWSIYDGYNDPLGLYAEAKAGAAAKGWEGDQKLTQTLYEKLIRDEGFAGARWRNPKLPTTPGQDSIMLFQPAKVGANGKIPVTDFEQPLDAQLLKATKENQGVTFRLTDKKNLYGEPNTAVALFPEHTRVYTEDAAKAAELRGEGKEVIEAPLTPAALRKYRKDKGQELANPNHSLGIWDEEGAQWLDVVATPAHEKGPRPTARAELLGRLLGEKAVFDLESGQPLSTGGMRPGQLLSIEERRKLLDPNQTPFEEVLARLQALENPTASPSTTSVAPRVITPELAGMEHELELVRPDTTGKPQLEAFLNGETMPKSGTLSRIEPRGLSFEEMSPEQQQIAARVLTGRDVGPGALDILEGVSPARTAPKALEAPKTIDLMGRKGSTIDLMAQPSTGGAIDLTNGGVYQPTTNPSADDVTRHMAELTDMNQRAEARYADSANDPLVKDWAAKGGTKLLSVAPLAGAAAPEGTFSDDPETDARIRKYLTVAGLAAPAVFGAAAMFPKALQKELDTVRLAMEKEMKGPDGKGVVRDSAIRTRLRDMIRFFATDDKQAQLLEGLYHTIPLPTYKGVNFDTRKAAGKLVVQNKTTGARLSAFTAKRLDVAYEKGHEVGAHWGNPEWIAKLVDNDPELGVQFARTLGATSPGTKTHWNTAQAAEIFIRHILQGEPLAKVIKSLEAPSLINVKSKMPNLERVAYGGRIYREKVENLAGNELGVKHRIPIDLWLMRAMGAATDKTPGKKLYRLMEEGFLKFAATKNEDPFTVMAKVWTGMQHIAGTPTPSFASTAEKMGLNQSLLDPAYQDYVKRNIRTMFTRTLEGSERSLFDEAPPVVTRQPAHSLEEFLAKVQPEFLRSQYRGDVLGKNRMTRQDARDLWDTLSRLGAAEGLEPPR
jgi:hypothetical protein